jgi:hypothetical protein
VLHEQRQADHERDRDQDYDQVLDREPDGVARQQVLVVDDVGEVEVRDALPELADAHEDERDADRRNQGGQLRRVAQRSVDDPVHREVQRGAEDHADRERQEDAAGGARRSGVGQAELRDQGQREECAQHEQVAVGEVDQLDDAVHHRVADRDEREERPRGEAVDELLEEDVARPGGGDCEECQHHPLSAMGRDALVFVVAQ